MSWLRRQPLAVTAVAAACFALWLYWPILQLPLSFDDLLHIRLVKGQDYLSIWQPEPDFVFYRPVMLLPVLLTRSLFAYYPAPFVYGLNLALHALDAALLAALAWRLWPRWPRALAAGLLFASYPFSYQAVAVFGNNIYPLLVALVLLALHSYLRGLDGKKGWWLVTAVLFVIGLFGHQLMVLFGFYAALAHGAYTGKSGLKNWRSPYLLFIAAGACYIVLYQFLPAAAAAPTTEPALRLPEILYFVQAMVYPFAWLAGQLLSVPGTAVVLTGLFITLLLTIWAAKWPGNRPALLAGWGWWALSALLVTITLSTDYVLHGPRLTYLGSAGVCLLWAVILDALYRSRPAGRLLAFASLATILLIGVLFTRGRVAALANIGTPVAAFVEVMAARPLDEGVLLVNLPSWMAPVHNPFPIGVNHVALMGEHIFAEELVWENLNQMRPVRAIGVPALLGNPGYAYGIHVQNEAAGDPAAWSPGGAHVFITRYTEAGAQPAYTGYFSAAEAAPTPLAQFGDYTLVAATAVVCNNTLTASLTWLPPAAPAPDTSIFVQALAADGRLLGQNDGPPLGLPADQLPLPPGWQMHDSRTIALDSATAPAALLLGVYDYRTGERFAASDTAARPLADNALRLPLQRCP